MSRLDDEISRQQANEAEVARLYRNQNAPVGLRPDVREAIADFLNRRIPTSGAFWLGQTTSRTGLFRTTSEPPREPAWVLFYADKGGAPGLPNIILTPMGDVRYRAAYDDPFMPLTGSSNVLSSHQSTGDRIRIDPRAGLDLSGQPFADALIGALAGLVRTKGATLHPGRG